MFTRRVPGTTWIRIFASNRAEPGRGWLYGGAVYRLCLRSERLGYAVGLMVMPASQTSETFRGRRRTAYLRGLAEGRYTA
ncbi:hypothetical protein GCM10027273_09930 [Nocardioides pakistanensis]